MSYLQLQQHLDGLLSNPENYNLASAVCRKYLADNLGSTQLILNKVNEDLKRYISA